MYSMPHDDEVQRRGDARRWTVGGLGRGRSGKLLATYRTLGNTVEMSPVSDHANEITAGGFFSSTLSVPALASRETPKCLQMSLSSLNVTCEMDQI